MTSSSKKASNISVRNTRPEDIDQIIEICRRVYTASQPWGHDQLLSHLSIFPQGQLVAVDDETGRVVGMASSLIVLWDDYAINDSWKDFTDSGLFTNHDPKGRTLYGAEVMVDPLMQGRGIGKKIYAGRREIVHSLGLLRIRAGARLRGFVKFKDALTPAEYVLRVIDREIGDPTLTFQLKQGFRVLDVAHDYLHSDPESCGHAAIIEWINHKLAKRSDYRGRDPRFAHHRRKAEDAQIALDNHNQQ